MSMHSEPSAEPPVHSGLQSVQPLAFPARFSDGLTAATEAVTVTYTAAGLEISKTGVLNAFRTRLWPYPELAASASLMAKTAADVLLTTPADPGCTLFVDNRDFVRILADRAPHLRARSSRWRAAAPWLGVTVGVAAIAAGIWAFNISPARIVAGFIPDGVRQTMGRRIIATMSDNKRVCSTPEGDAALAKLTNRLSQAADAKFNVVVVDWSLLNAFAAPGEQIVLTRELVQGARNADEVAAVLAHEMGHGLERHPETGVVRLLGMSAALELITGGGGGTLGSAGLILAQLSYTRVAERQADDHSYKILRTAGIPATGFRDFFKRAGELEEKSEVAKTIGQYDVLRTHPQSADRVKRALAQPAYPTTPALDDTDWQALRDICGPKRTPVPKTKTP
jgi:beta-barrel assembly-enhancing protease